MCYKCHWQGKCCHSKSSLHLEVQNSRHIVQSNFVFIVWIRFYYILLKVQWSNQNPLSKRASFLEAFGTVHTQWERTPRNLTWKLSFKLIQSQSFSYWTSIEVVTANTWEHFELLRSTQNQLLKIHNGAKYFMFEDISWKSVDSFEIL